MNNSESDASRLTDRTLWWAGFILWVGSFLGLIGFAVNARETGMAFESWIVVAGLIIAAVVGIRVLVTAGRRKRERAAAERREWRSY